MKVDGEETSSAANLESSASRTDGAEGDDENFDDVLEEVDDRRERRERPNKDARREKRRRRGENRNTSEPGRGVGRNDGGGAIQLRKERTEGRRSQRQLRESEDRTNRRRSRKRERERRFHERRTRRESTRTADENRHRDRRSRRASRESRGNGCRPKTVDRRRAGSADARKGDTSRSKKNTGRERTTPLVEPTANDEKARRVSNRPDVANSGRVQESEAPRRAEEIRAISEELVDAVRVGTDQTRRQVVLVDVDTPSGEQVRIRLRRDGEGYETRLRAESDELSRRLRRHRDQLRDSAAENGVQLTSIEIV